MANELKGISADKLSELMGKARTRNTYGPKLLEFMESDEAGINPAEVWPMEFGEKLTTTLYQGFMNAAKKSDLKDKIKILQSDDNVFILHNERAAVAREELQAENAAA